MADAPWWRRHRALLMALCWAAACAVMLAARAHAIAGGDFPDVDDRMRLLEVRDWLGGQSFWDVSQHRMNPPFGAPMHWSRLVDLPLAAAILLLRPLLGPDGAETAAAAIVPLLTLGAVMLGVGAVARRLAGEGVALAAFAATAACVVATVQLAPMRIDHHGWEIACALAATAALLARDARRGGVAAGVAIAVGLQISLELLPFAAALGAVAALGWLARPDAAARARLAGFAAALAGTEAALWALLRLPGDAAAHCDAVSPPHLVALALVAAGVAALVRLAPGGVAARAAGLAATAIVAAAAFRAFPPHCGLDAFADVEPIVRRYWLDQVPEGLPLWRQTALVAVGAIGFPLVGLGCAAAAWRRAEDRGAWAGYALLLLAATLVAVMVERAGALANALAVPAAAWAMAQAFARAQRSGSAAVRVAGSCLAVAAFSPPAPAMVAAALAREPVPVRPAAPACDATAGIRPLAALPPARVLATIDLAPAILLRTPHAVLASGHHRNHRAIAELLRAFLGPDATASAVMARHGLRYVMLCPDQAEIGFYRRVAPAGFAAHLAAGRAPAWLAPVPLPGTPVRVWRVAG